MSTFWLASRLYSFSAFLYCCFFSLSILFPYAPIAAHKKRDAARREMVRLFDPIISNRRARKERGEDNAQDFLQVRPRRKQKECNDDTMTPTAMLIILWLISCVTKRKWVHNVLFFFICCFNFVIPFCMSISHNVPLVSYLFLSLQELVDCRYENRRELTTDEIVGLLIACLFAGQHTSNITATWLGVLIAAHKDKILPRLLQEQKDILGYAPAPPKDYL